MQSQNPDVPSCDDGRTLDERAAALSPMLDDPDPRLRKSAAIALGRLACTTSTSLLCRALGDQVEGVRVLACQALGRLADPQSASALIARAHDESVEVRAGVLWALANIAAHGGLTAEQRAGLFTPVVVLAFDPDDGVRADAAAVLGSLRDERATDALSVLLEDACPRVRANACASLGLTDDAAGLAALLGVLEADDKDALVLVSALDGVARRAERAAIVADTQDGERVVRAVCRYAGEPGETPVVSSTASQTPASEVAPTAADVRATAVWALGYVGGLAPAMREQVRGLLDAAAMSVDEWARRYAEDSRVRLGFVERR